MSYREVGLVIKCMNAPKDHAGWRSVMESCGNDPRIITINETFYRERILGLFNCCDAFVSLHRAEGFGRTIAEAMLLGKPVVVTNFSGNTDFTNLETAFLVRRPFIPVKKDDYHFGEGQYWCDPNVETGRASDAPLPRRQRTGFDEGHGRPNLFDADSAQLP